ncbi:MAG TPA: hypothetical protein H9971_01205 [Candidatus Dorea merdavium]|nr:hypothetical protein [Candidatus Dorea merdavium]
MIKRKQVMYEKRIIHTFICGIDYAIRGLQFRAETEKRIRSVDRRDKG